MHVAHIPAVAGRVWLLLALCAGAAGAPGCRSIVAALPGAAGTVEGEVRFTEARGAAPDLGPVVVYLESEARRPAMHSASGGEALIVVYDENLPPSPGLLAVARGERVRFASQSGAAHRLFAIRGAERIEVEVPPGRVSASVALEQEGWLRFYCALHDAEAWDAFVSPSPHFARVDAEGGYRIAGVPAGSYRLSIWSPAVEGAVRRIQVRAGDPTRETIWLDPDRIAR